MTMAFLNIEFLRQPFVDRAQGPHLGGFGRVGGQGLWGRFLPLIEQFGVDVEARAAASVGRLSLARHSASARNAAS